MNEGQQRAYVVDKASRGTLAPNDPHLQDVLRRAKLGVGADQNARDRVMEISGGGRGDVNKVI